jgi:anti-anti-sigma factor
MSTENHSGDIWTVEPRPEPNLGTELATVANTAYVTSDRDVIVDFSKVDIVTSSSLSKLLNIRKLLHDHGRRLILCGLSADCMAIFVVAGLDQVFEFAEDKSEAVEAIKYAHQPKTQVSS